MLRLAPEIPVPDRCLNFSMTTRPPDRREAFSKRQRTARVQVSRKHFCVGAASASFATAHPATSAIRNAIRLAANFSGSLARWAYRAVVCT